MKKIKALAITAIVAVIGFSAVSCPTGPADGSPQTGKKGKADVVIVDISEVSEWDYLAATKGGASMVYNVDETTGKPTRLFLKPDKDSDAGFTFMFKENGLPDKAVFNGLILLFENFDGYQYDMALIYPDDTIEYHYGIQTDVNWNVVGSSDAGRSVGARSLDEPREPLDYLGYAITAGSCVGALFFPPLVVGCFVSGVSTALQTTIEVFEYAGVLGEFTAGAGIFAIDGVNLVLDTLGCVGGGPFGWVDCVSAIQGFASLIFDDEWGFMAYKELLINEAKEKMKPYPMTVNFHANGGSGTVPASITIQEGDSDYITFPSGDGLSRDGYFFNGWNDSPGYNKYNPGGCIVTRNASFYAVWEQILTGVPTGVTARAASSGSIMVSWNPVSDADGYYVYRSTSAVGAYAKVGALSSALYLLDTGLSANTTYYYRVSYYAGNNGGISKQSDSAYARTPAAGSGTAVTFSGLTADGGMYATTTALTLTFSAAIDGLSAADITLFGMEGVQKGTLGGSGTEYTLGVSGFSEGGTVIVSVLKAGYSISGSVQSTLIYCIGQGPGIGPPEMVFVPGGTFQLGKNLGTAATGDITPVSNVTVSSFYIGKYEVTQSQWYAVMGKTQQEQQYEVTYGGDDTSNYGKGAAYPVYYVSWYEALVFCNKLSIAEGLTPAYRIANSTDPDDWGDVPTGSDNTWNAVTVVSGSTGYRLPTNAQWEYAAKGGNTGESFTYAGSDNIGDVAWYQGNSNNGGATIRMSHEVGTKAPNGLGLYDMSGNVQEWCWDRYNEGGYTSEDKTDPTGPSIGTITTYGPARITRSGSFDAQADYARSVHWLYTLLFNYLGKYYNDVGFRLVRPAN